MAKGRVTGIGGIFFKSNEPKKLTNWYNKHLGLVTNEYGSMFEFRDTNNPEKKGYLQWSAFSKDSTYMEPSEQPFMINYRVVNIEALVNQLKKEGVEIVDEIATYDYGKFVHIMDPEGNKIELWEPVDEGFGDYSNNTTK
ncbi:MAG: VOC family protein [Fulvivirga sp.]|uniref:VOC family protein n=1 Tax=Fulvivirga sp. TaxID=1931237 RepID=UPI0032EB35C4